MKLLFTLLLSVPFISFGQAQSNFNKLIDITNHCLKQYAKLTPFGDEYFPISSFDLSKMEIKDLIIEAGDDDALSKNKDSIQSYFMITYFQEKIIDQINQIVKTPDFQASKMKELLTPGELSIVISDDNKLINFSLGEKTGGSYDSRISIMHYTGSILNDAIQKDKFNSFFNRNGYSNIYALKTDNGIKYVLTGYVRECSYCFLRFVRLVTFTDDGFNEEFMYSVENSDWNEGVTYDHETRTILVDYQIDDLTPFCSCGEEIKKEKFGNDKYGDYQGAINCRCKFIFNGVTFELVEEGWKKVDNNEGKE